MVNANLGLGHEVANGVLIENVPESNASRPIDLSCEQELNQVEEKQVRLFRTQVFVTCLELSIVYYLNLEIYLFSSEVLWNA